MVAHTITITKIISIIAERILETLLPVFRGYMANY